MCACRGVVVISHMGTFVRVLGVSMLAIALWFGPAAYRFLVGAAALARLTGVPLPEDWEQRLLQPIVEERLTLHTQDGEVRARQYKPRALRPEPYPPVMLLHGVHALGIDEPRLSALAQALASAGLWVVTPELPQLVHYDIDPGLVTDVQALATAWATHTHARSVGVIGISFAGGLALMAAAEQAGDEPIGFVVSVGAHHDLLRICRYYAGEPVRGPQGEEVNVEPHPYGARVMLRQHLGSLVSGADLPGATTALDTYLHDEHSAARRLAQQLSAEGRQTLQVLLDNRGSETLSGWLQQYACSRRAALSAASPHGHLAGLRVPVLLLHGAADPVIPSIETLYLAREVPPRALRASLVTELLRHAEFPQPPALRPALALARFMQQILGAADDMAAANARVAATSTSGGHDLDEPQTGPASD